ncbi:signal recognition particle-docking protein FtsY [Aquiluna sp.]|nr:signal recognition particle-docking protein FtsY [Aquiluna sp.]
MFKFLKRLRGKKEEAQPQPDAVATEVVPAPVVEAPVSPPEPATEVPASVTATDPEPEKDIEPEPVFKTPIEAVVEPAGEPEPPKEAEPKAEVVEVELPKRSLSDGIRSLFSSNVDIEDLEDILLLADFGVEASVEITESLRKAASKAGATSDAELRLLLKELLVDKLHRDDLQLNLSDGKLPYVFLVVGVNGAGKTTTIGKLAKWLRDGEWEVVLGAADTFRAAAVDQLATWAERSGAGIVRPERDGQDPASVAYQTVELAIKNDADIAIVDTAGRLQNKKDLMDELGKIRRAVEKQAQINEVLLVIDATTGQNAINQAKAFTEVAEVTGIVMTKLDGTAKGGILYTIQQQLNLPVKLVGVGEGVNDFAFFSAEEFANGLVARKPDN